MLSDLSNVGDELAKVVEGLLSILVPQRLFLSFTRELEACKLALWCGDNFERHCSQSKRGGGGGT